MAEIYEKIQMKNSNGYAQMPVTISKLVNFEDGKTLDNKLEHINLQIENKQNSTDENLETEDKTISGAINEIKQKLDSLLSIEEVEF